MPFTALLQQNRIRQEKGIIM